MNDSNIKKIDLEKCFNDFEIAIKENKQKIDSEQELEQKLINSHFLNCGAPLKNLNNAGFEKFICYKNNERQKKLLQTCKDFLLQIFDGDKKILVLHGDPGTGKTFFSLSMIKEMCKVIKPMSKYKKWTRDISKCIFRNTNLENPCSECPYRYCESGDWVIYDTGIKEFYRGYYVKSDDLCEKVKNYYTSKEKKFYINVPFLVIDEIGRPTGFNAKVESEVLFKIIDERKDNEKPTVLCSNLNYLELQELLGKALFSRIAECGLFFETSGIEDMRSKKIKDYILNLGHSLFSWWEA